MPTYSYKCQECGSEKDAIRRIADRKNGPDCCGQTMKQVIVAPMIQAQILGGGDCPGYVCPVTQEFVTSRKRRREIMKENGCHESGDTKGAHS